MAGSVTDKLVTLGELKLGLDTKVGTSDVQDVSHGGTGGTTAAAARANLDVYSKSETNSTISQSTINKANYSSGTWTPHLYDYTTIVRSLPTAYYHRIGNIVIAFGNWNNPDLSGITQMMQIRNLPMNVVFGGCLYIATIAGQGANHTIQTSDQVLFRPNIISSNMANPSAPGWVSFMLIGLVVS